MSKASVASGLQRPLTSGRHRSSPLRSAVKVLPPLPVCRCSLCDQADCIWWASLCFAATWPMVVWVCTRGGWIVYPTPWPPSERQFIETHRLDKETVTGESSSTILSAAQIDLDLPRGKPFKPGKGKSLPTSRYPYMVMSVPLSAWPFVEVWGSRSCWGVFMYLRFIINHDSYGSFWFKTPHHSRTNGS